MDGFCHERTAPSSQELTTVPRGASKMRLTRRIEKPARFEHQAFKTQRMLRLGKRRRDVAADVHAAQRTSHLLQPPARALAASLTSAPSGGPPAGGMVPYGYQPGYGAQPTPYPGYGAPAPAPGAPPPSNSS